MENETSWAVELYKSQFEMMDRHNKTMARIYRVARREQIKKDARRGRRSGYGFNAYSNPQW